MRARSFLKKLDHERIVRAIRRAESCTTGEVRVVVTRRASKDALAEAHREFTRLGMDRTPDRNAVLILLSPRGRTLALLGDEAIHRRCGEAFWSQVVSDCVELLSEGRSTEAIERAVQRVGTELAKHFPTGSGGPGHENRLPDDVVER